MVRVKAKRLLIGIQSLFLAIEVFENITLVEVGQLIVGVKAKRLLISSQSPFAEIEIVESIALVQPFLFGFLWNCSKFGKLAFCLLLEHRRFQIMRAGLCLPWSESRRLLLN